jgi:hypothetical protein
MPTVFALAPMTTGLRVLTWALFGVPAALLYAALESPEPVHTGLLVVTAFVALTYASVWLVWRPSRFEIGADALRIVWPLRARTIPRSAIRGARMVTAAEFRRAHGWGMRIGAGGLWGGFGLLKTSDTTFSMWISRTDRLVIVDLRDARPLLVTPDAPERFVALLGA